LVFQEFPIQKIFSLGIFGSERHKK